MKFLANVKNKYLIKSENISNIWYHLTDRGRFKLDSKFTPADNSISIYDRSGKAGIYVASRVDVWVNGHNYWRPFVVEFKIDPSVFENPQVHGRWGGERFIPASLFNNIEIQRVIPLDAYAREKFEQHGWIESELKKEFDTGKPIIAKPWEYPFRGYKYKGKNVRDMSSSEINNLKQQLKKVKG